MRSIANELEEEDRAALAAMTPAERVALALQLGERDLQAFAGARGLNPAQARRVLQQQKQLGRAPSGCMSRLHEQHP